VVGGRRNRPINRAPFSMMRGRQVGRFFGRDPHYSRQEIEAQAKEAIEARVGLGRPPAEDWQPLDARLAAAETRPVSQPAPLVVPEHSRDLVPATVQGPQPRRGSGL